MSQVICETSVTVTVLQDEDKLVAAFEAGLSAGGKRLRLAVLDLILSFPPVILPVQRLCKIFKYAHTPPCACAADQQHSNTAV